MKPTSIRSKYSLSYLPIHVGCIIIYSPVHLLSIEIVGGLFILKHYEQDFGNTDFL